MNTLPSDQPQFDSKKSRLSDHSKTMNKGKKGKGSAAGRQASSSSKGSANTSSNDSQNQRQASPEDLTRIMTECSLTAKALKKNISEKLESLGTDNEGAQNLQESSGRSETGQPASLVDTNIKIREVLEKSIKEKLSDLEQALKDEEVVSVPDQLVKEEDNVDLKPDVEQTDKQEAVETKASPPPESGRDSSSPPSSGSSKGASITATTEPVVQPTKKPHVRAKVGHKEKMTVEQVLKTLSSHSSDADKLQALAASYIEVMEENRGRELKLKTLEKGFSQLVREKDTLQGDHNRMILAKSRLENLCRELQRQNKVIKEESLSRIKAEEEKRKQIANKFQTTLNEIMQLVQENQEKNVVLKNENQELASKLKLLMDHYEVWEKSVEKIIQKKDLERQLMTEKMTKASLVFAQEKETMLLEKQQLFLTISDLQQKGILMNENESSLREQLALYSSKYHEFQDVLTKSNETFGSFKKDMENMSKQIKKLEKETLVWKSKFEKCNQTLSVVSADRSTKDQLLQAAQNKVQTLEKLCRALQDRKQQSQDANKTDKTSPVSNHDSN